MANVDHEYEISRINRQREIRSALAMCRRHLLIWSTRGDDIDPHTMKQIRSTLAVVAKALEG